MTKVIIKAADGTGAVDLYHDSTKKISTYASGAQVNSTNLQFTEAGTAYIDKLSNGSGLVFRASTSSDADTQVCTVHGGPGGVGALDLPDNTRLRFGTGNDLALYYDSSNTYFDQTDNTGNMNFRTNSKILFKSVGSSETIAKFIKDGTCELYYDNSKKIETIATGVNVTGGIRLGGDNAANELDDYEEGSFTMTAVSAGGTAQPLNGSADQISYIKIGRLVYIQGRINFASGTPDGTGQLILAGLPFTTSNTLAEQGAMHQIAINTHGVDLPSDCISTFLEFTNNAVGAYCVIQKDNASWAGLDVSWCNNGDYLALSGCYITDS